MQYEYILMVIPIIIIVAFLVVIAKRITDGERPDISGAVLGTIIIAVGLLIMVPIISSVDPQFEYDDEDKTFTLYKNVTGTEFSWGSAANAESLIIEDTVTTISAGAFASFSDLKYISIPESLETIGEGAFPTLKDYMDQTITEPEAGEYVGAGDGILYLCDENVYTYSNDAITGLSSSASGAKVLVLPSYHGSTELTSVGNNAFKTNTDITKVFALPKSTIATIGVSSFQGCTALSEVHFPDGLTLIRGSAFGTAGIAEAVFPDTLETIEGYAFQGCSSLSVISFPASIQTVAAGGFGTTNGVTSITFAEGFNPSTMNYGPWNFYASDGETQLERTAANLAGKTFQGISTALVEVLPDRSTLTAAQTLQVQELARTAARTLVLEESELQISEKAELAEA